MSEPLKTLLLLQLHPNLDEGSWIIPVEEAIQGLTTEQASYSDSESGHSIWQLVNHLIFWNERYLRRFRGEDVPKYEDLNEKTFLNEAGESSWDDAVTRLGLVLQQWRDAISSLAEADLHRTMPVQGYDPVPWFEVLTNVVVHNAYHAGQIVLLRKQQGVWKNRH